MSDADVAAALRAEVFELMGPEEAEEAIREALAHQQAEEIPVGVEPLRNFVLGPLWQALVEHRSVHKFAERAGVLVRRLARLAEGHDPQAAAAIERYAVILTSEPYVFQVARAHAPDAVELRAARRLLDLAPLSPLRYKAPVTLVVHRTSSPVTLEELATFTPVLRKDCRIVLSGTSPRERQALLERLPVAARWESGGSISELAAAL